MTPLRLFLSAALILTLAACGNQKGNTTGLTTGLNVLKGAANRVLKGKPQPVNTRALLNRQIIDSYGRPLIFVELPKTGVNSGMELQAINGSVARFGTPDGTALAYDRGILIRSHGLGFDLISADVSDLAAALRHGSSENALRVERHLGGDNKEITRSFVCTVHAEARETIEIFQRLHSVTRMAEVCQNVDTQITNTYWVGPSGQIWKSKVWIGPELGFVVTEVL